MVEGRVAPAFRRSEMDIGERIGFEDRYLPVHVIQPIYFLVRYGARLGMVEPRAWDVDVAEGNILPVREERRVFRPIEQIGRSGDAKLRRGEIVRGVRQIERAVDANDSGIFSATSSLPRFGGRDDGSVETLEVDAVGTPCESYGADFGFVLRSVQEEDSFV